MADSDGRKALLHLALGNKESYANWLDFLRDLVRRGLRAPVQTTTDGSPGLIRAVEEVFPNCAGRVSR
jgi:putative transposase